MRAKLNNKIHRINARKNAPKITWTKQRNVLIKIVQLLLKSGTYYSLTFFLHNARIINLKEVYVQYRKTLISVSVLSDLQSSLLK